MPERHYLTRISASPSRMLVVGVTVALLVAAVVMTWLMRPPLGDLTQLIRTLALTSIISLGAGFLLYRRGLARSPSLSLTLIMSYVWSALLILFNVLVMAQQMFFSPHD